MGLDSERQAGPDQQKLTTEARQALKFVNTVFQNFNFDWQANVTTDSGRQWKSDVTCACLAFMLGVKPAVLCEGVKDTTPLQAVLDEAGKNAFVYIPGGSRDHTVIVDRDQVMARIAEESEWAHELGWREGMTPDEWITQANPGGNGEERALIGFFLGYPKSAIQAYSNKAINKAAGVDIEGPYGGRTFYFTTDETLEHADDVETLTGKTRTAFMDAGFGRFFREMHSERLKKKKT